MLRTKKFPWFEVPPDAPGFVTDTATSPAAASAVAGTCTELGTAPGDGSHLADFQKVDALLDAAEEGIRRSFESAPELAVDRHLQAVDNLIACWTINSARDLAWRNAAVLWELRGDPGACGLFLDGLAAATALASQLLLTAV